MEEEHVCSISELSGDRAIAPQGKALFEVAIACQSVASPANLPSPPQVTMLRIVTANTLLSRLVAIISWPRTLLLT